MKHAFTLPELLIVIVIIAILGAIAIPAIRNGTGGSDIPMVPVNGSTRFRVDFQGAFQASSPDKASRRSIYTIHDNQTGVVYLAIEGCGTAQLVTEPLGRGTHEVEQ